MPKKLSEMTLEELWQLFPIILTEPNPAWEAWYLEERDFLLSKLKNDGYNLYITSNMSEYHAKQIREMPITQYFKGMLFSAEIKVRKPYRKFFETALEQFKVNPAECLFIDDLAENVEGARECGIDGFVFKGNAKEAEAFIYGYGK